jgi:hypothetical protein
MHTRNLIEAHVRRRFRGVDLAAVVNATIDANVLERQRGDDAGSKAREPGRRHRTAGAEDVPERQRRRRDG